MAMTVVVVAAAASAMAVKGGGDFGLEGCKLQQNLEAQNWILKKTVKENQFRGVAKIALPGSCQSQWW